MTNCKCFVAFAFCLLNSKPFESKHKDIFLHYQDTISTPKKFNVANTISRCLIYGKISPNCSSVWLFHFLIFLNSKYNKDLTLHSLLCLFSFSLEQLPSPELFALFSFMTLTFLKSPGQLFCRIFYSCPTVILLSIKHWHDVAQVRLCPSIALKQKADAKFYCEGTGSPCLMSYL